MTKQYRVIPSKTWLHEDGHTASIYGLIPWAGRPEERPRWTLVERGWTLEGEIAARLRPFETREEAEAYAALKYQTTMGVVPTAKSISTGV